MFINSPIEVSGKTQDAYVDLLIADPQDRSLLTKVGTVFLPGLTAEGTRFDFFFSFFLFYFFLTKQNEEKIFQKRKINNCSRIK